MEDIEAKPGSIRDPRTYAIIGAAMEVHRELGSGFLETVYEEALAMEFTQRGIPFARQTSLPVYYKGSTFETNFRSDFICYGTIIVELKAITRLTEIEEAQLLNYLKATKFKLGLLFNFAESSLKYRRMVL